jgi:hypothetical protein
LLNPDWNSFKNSNKDYDETLYPLDHERSGHIRDFSLFNHFVKPMPAGVTVTCVMDCCHSGAVLELPYSYKPTAGGTIRMQRNMSSLSNLAFLYLLAGGMLPPGFENVAANIEDVTGGNVEDFQGTGMEDGAQDYAGDQEDAPVYGEAGGGDFGASDAPADFGAPDAGDYGDPGVVQGYNVPDDGARGFGDAGGPSGGPVGWDGGDAGGEVWGGGAPTGIWEGGDGGGWDGGDGGDAPDMDCGCLADILGALLDQE